MMSFLSQPGSSRWSQEVVLGSTCLGGRGILFEEGEDVFGDGHVVAIRHLDK